MKKKYSLLFILLLSCSLYAQKNKTETLELKVKENLFKRPDSAKIYLRQLLNHSSDRSDTAVARTHSELGITYNQIAKYDSAEYHFKKGIALSEKYPLNQAKIYSNLAINYRTTAHYKESLNHLKTALGLYRKAGNLNGEGVVFGEMASNFSYMQQKEKAITYLSKAIAIFKKTKDPRLFILKQKLANAYYNNENYKFAIDIYEDILPDFEQNKGVPYYLTLLAYGESLVHMGKMKEGEKRLLEAKNGLEKIDNFEYMYYAWGKLGKIYKDSQRNKLASRALRESYNYLLEVHSTRLLEIATGYLSFLNQQKDYDTALRVIESVEKETDSFKNKMNAGDELNFLISAKKTFRKKQLYRESLQIYDRVDFLKDSLRQAVDKVKLKELEESYQNEIQREKNLALSKSNTLLKKYNRKQKYLTFLGFLFAIGFCIMGIIIYKYHRKKLALQKEGLTNLEKSNRVLKENQKLVQELILEKEKNISDKERELVAISLEMADIQNQIKTVLDTSKKDEISKERSSQIEGILNHKNYWKHFKTKFIEVHPEFGDKLGKAFPNLSENDIAFCSLLKLQLTNKEIASLLGISHQSVISKKYRIKKKMDIQEQEKDFEEIIREL